MRKTLLILLMLCSAWVCHAQFWNVHSVKPPVSLRNAPDTVTLYIIGDVMMHSRQLEYDHHSFLSRISHKLGKADFAIANMEFPLGGKPYTGYPLFSTPDWYPEYVSDECGVDVFLLANNHVLDKGHAGLKRTMEIYGRMRDEGRIAYTGAAVDEEDYKAVNPLIIKRKGISIALINFTYGTNIGPSGEWPRVSRMKREEVAEAIRSARAQGAHFIIALPHWGTEYELRHNSTQQEWAEWLVSKGVDAIVGSHPHVVQDTTHIKGVPVIYSVGNAVSNMSATNTRLELGVKLSFTHDPAGKMKVMLEPELDFMWCTLPGTLTDSYSTIYVKEWASRRGDWLNPSDFDNMTGTLERVMDATGIGLE